MEQDSFSSIWVRALKVIEAEMSHAAFITWFGCIEPELREDGSFILFVPTEFHKLILETRYLELIRNSIASVYPEYNTLDEAGQASFVIAVKRADLVNTQPQASQVPRSPFTMKLNPSFTYNSYIAGKCNNEAVQASRDIAEHPSSKGNPLYIYGGVGTGKTHLLQAMASQVLAYGQSKKVLYLKADEFISEMIRRLMDDRISDFVSYLETLDFLIIDDLQITVGKERTLEEICRVFDELISRGVRIVVASADSPEKVGAVSGRLASLLEKGKTAELKEHDAIVKRIILKMHAETKGITIPDDVIESLIVKNKFEIREMIGFTNKLAIASRLSGQDICISTVKRMLSFI